MGHEREYEGAVCMYMTALTSGVLSAGSQAGLSAHEPAGQRSRRLMWLPHKHSGGSVWMASGGNLFYTVAHPTRASSVIVVFVESLFGSCRVAKKERKSKQANVPMNQPTN